MGEKESSHHLRFYIVLITLVVGGIFFFWYLNSNNLSLTGAFSGDNFPGSDDIDIDSEKIGSADNFPESADYTSKSGSYPLSKDKTIDEKLLRLGFLLHFSEIPLLNREVAFDSMLINFNDFSTTIKINNGKLGLSNLEQATLSIEGFAGKLGFNKGVISLNGKAKKVEINSVALSSANEITLLFDSLNYQSFSINNIGLKDLTLPMGTGELKVDEKLAYNLDSDSLSFSAFWGSLEADKSAEFVFKMEGKAAGIDAKGQRNLVIR